MTESTLQPTKDSRVCVVGGGAIGSLHIELHTNGVGIDGVGIVEVNDVLRKSYSDQGYQTYVNLEDSFADGYKVYDICVPTFLHLQVIKAILFETDAMIMCEKPLVLNWSEMEALVQAHPDSEERLVCAFVERFNEPFIKAKAWAENHDGPYVMEFVRRTKKPVRQDWVKDPAKGGEIILDLGIHDIDASLWFSGSELDSVTKYESGIDSEIFEVRFKDGSTAKYTAGWDVPQDSEIGIINTFKLKTKNNNIHYDSSMETISFDDTKLSVIPRFPVAYQKEVDAARQLRNAIDVRFPKFEELKKSYQVFDAFKKERNVS